MWQIVEKDDIGTDWAMVRYDNQAMSRFETSEEAVAVAIKYLNSRNCDNSLTKSEKRGAIEAFMMRPDGCFLGVLDGKDWYLTDRHDNIVTDKKYFELEGKTEVAVRPVPGM